MKAMVLDANEPIEGSPLKLRDVPDPQASPGQGTAVPIVD